MVKKTQEVKQHLAEILELPKDVIMNAPKMTVIGNIQVSIENHLGIIRYDNNIVKINTSAGMYTIIGADIIINNITSEEIVITGHIENIDISS